MNRSKLLAKVAADTQVSPAVVQAVVDNMLENITECLKRGESVTIPGFGRFELRSRKQHNFTNPRTGENVLLDAKVIPGFVASNQLKEKLTEK